MISEGGEPKDCICEILEVFSSPSHDESARDCRRKYIKRNTYLSHQPNHCRTPRGVVIIVPRIIKDGHNPAHTVQLRFIPLPVGGCERGVFC